MKRNPCPTAPVPGYPARRPSFRGRMLLVGAVGSLAVLPGCPPQKLWATSGDIAIIDSGNHARTVILPAEGAHHLDFPDPDGWYEYAVEIEVADEEAAAYLEDHAEEVLAVLDAVILGRAVADVCASAEAPIEQAQAVDALADWLFSRGFGPDLVSFVEFLPVSCETEEAIPGDLG